MRYVHEHFFESFLKKTEVILERYLCLLFFILFGRQLFIIHAMTLASEVETEETISAVFAVVTEETIAAVIEVLRKLAAVAAVYIDNLIAILGIIRLIEIDTVF